MYKFVNWKLLICERPLNISLSWEWGHHLKASNIKFQCSIKDRRNQFWVQIWMVLKFHWLNMSSHNAFIIHNIQRQFQSKYFENFLRYPWECVKVVRLIWRNWKIYLVGRLSFCIAQFYVTIIPLKIVCCWSLYLQLGISKCKLAQHSTLGAHV